MNVFIALKGTQFLNFIRRPQYFDETTEMTLRYTDKKVLGIWNNIECNKDQHDIKWTIGNLSMGVFICSMFDSDQFNINVPGWQTIAIANVSYFWSRSI